MFKTEYGLFNGDRWENICQSCFKNKFSEESYFEILASPGDYGIEGFTRTGKVFQCYCPDEHYTREVLHKKQVDKITADLKKLRTYKEQLAKKLGDTLIEKWYFISPVFTHNKIVDHCTKKRDEVRSWNLPIINNSTFEVIPADIGFLQPEIHSRLKASEHKIEILPETIVSENERLKWKNKHIDLVETAQKKHSARFKEKNTKTAKNVDDLTDKTIKHHINGGIILKK